MASGRKHIFGSCVCRSSSTLQFPLYFLTEFFQIVSGRCLLWPSDDQTAIVGFRRLRDYVEVDVINDLGNDQSLVDLKNVDYRMVCNPHLVSNLPVVLNMAYAILAERDTENGAVCDTSYLQDVVVIKSSCHRDLLRNNQRILEILIWDVVELLAVPYRQRNVSVLSGLMTQTVGKPNGHFGITRE